MRRFLVRTLFGSICALLFALAGASAEAQFNYRDLAQINDVRLNGDAQRMGDRIRMVPAESSKGGSVWFTTKQRVADGFEATFTFQITEPGAFEGFEIGADGIAFVLQNSSLFEGGIGGGIGFEGIANSVAVEFDTYDNNPHGNPEPNGNHISVQTRGLEPNSPMQDFSLGSTASVPELVDGARHTARVRYRPGTLEVFLDNMERPLLTVGLLLDTLMTLDSGSCWMGFTAATGSSWANFDLFSLSNQVLLNIRDIFFDTGKDVLKPQSFPELRKLLGVLTADSELRIEIGGHTDNRGADAANLDLSRRRAEAVRSWLVANGIAADRVAARGYGASSPIATNTTDAGRAKNRRVEARMFKE